MNFIIVPWQKHICDIIKNAMFVRKKTFYSQDKSKREYLKIVETRREKGQGLSESHPQLMLSNYCYHYMGDYFWDFRRDRRVL